MKARKIVVPLDGSELAEAALAKAIEVARETPGATLVLMRAAEAPPFASDPIEAQVTVVRAAEDYLDDVAARVRADGVTATTSVWYGAATSSIVEVADTTRADLIVMSTHGRSGLGRLLIGSVAESVIRATHTPILLVRPPALPVVRPAARGHAVTTKEGSHV